MITKAFLILIWFAAVPIGMGSLPLFYTGSRKGISIFDSMVWGYALMFALFEAMALPAIFCRVPFATLKYIYAAVCLILAAVGLYISRKMVYQGTAYQIRRAVRLPWTVWAALLLVLVQMGAYVFGMATDLDDSFYVAMAGTTLETGGMFTHGAYTGQEVLQLPSRYVLAPFPIMLAFFSDVVHMHPAAVAHTVQPVFFLMLSYIIYGNIGKKLFSGDWKGTGFFLFFLALVQTFSYYSVYTQGTFMLIRIWQGKAVLAAVLLPAIFYVSFCCMQKEAERGDWMRLLCLMTASCLVSSMGMMLAPVMLGIMMLIYGVLGKRWRKILPALVCCLPNLACAAVYLVIR